MRATTLPVPLLRGGSGRRPVNGRVDARRSAGGPGGSEAASGPVLQPRRRPLASWLQERGGYRFGGQPEEVRPHTLVRHRPGGFGNRSSRIAAAIVGTGVQRL